MKERFELVEEPTGTWALFDDTTGVPASIAGRVLIGLSKEEATACAVSLLTDAAANPSRPNAVTTSDEEPR